MNGKEGSISILDKLAARLGIGRLGQNTLLSTAGLAVRALIQAGYLILLSRWMKPHGYGLFAGSVAAATLISPLSGWGISYVYTQWVARDRSKSQSLWATTLIQIAVSGTLLVLLLLLTSMILLSKRMDLISMLFVGIAELIALPVCLAASRSFMALGRGASSAITLTFVPGCRFIIALIFFILGTAGKPGNIAVFHLAGSILGMVAALYFMARSVGRPVWRSRMPIKGAIKSGTHYAAGSFVGTSYPEVDKILILQILGAVATGNYTVAFRVMSVLVVPISALVGAALPRLFSVYGSDTWRRIFKAMVIVSAGYGVFAILAAILIAPFMIDIFGPGFTDSIKYLMMLSPWALLYALHQSIATGLTSKDKQNIRVVIETTGLILILVLNLSLLPIMGVQGAVLSLLITETFMVICCLQSLRINWSK